MPYCLALSDFAPVDIAALRHYKCATPKQRATLFSYVDLIRRKEVPSFSDEECAALFHATLDNDFGADEVTRHSTALLDFAARVERLPIAVAVGANLLRQKTATPLDRGILRLRMQELTDGVRDVPGLFRAAIESQPEREQKLLAAGSICVEEGFWLPLAADIAELSEEDSEEAANRLVHSSLLRVIDREQRRFNVHALLREQVRKMQESDGLKQMQEHHAVALEKWFRDWEAHWQECRECLEEIIPAARFLWRQGQGERGWQLSYSAYLLSRRIGEWDAALRIMKHEELLWMRRNDLHAKSKLAASYNNQALVLKDWGELDQAMDLYKKPEALSLALGNRVGLQSSYGNQAVILYRWGRPEEAMTLHKKEEIIALELGDKTQLQRSYANQAVILYRWGRLEGAMALHKKEEAICLELNDKDALQKSLGNQALIMSSWGRLDEALALYDNEEAICQELGNKNELQRSYGNRAEILFMRGQRDEALALLQRQETMCQELGNKAGLASCYANQATLMRVQGKLQESLLLHRKAEAILVELGNRDGLSKSYSGQGLILFGLGRFDEAMALYKKEEEICLGLGSKEELQACYANQALALLRSGRLEEALTLLDKQENICLELGNKHGLGHCYWYRSCIAGAHGDRKAQKEKLEQALAIFTELKMPRQRDAVQEELDKMGSQ
jgi:tetratricopeptide (TPR) repeat protein